MQRSGARYRAANGARIPNLGEQEVDFMTAEGRQHSLMFQVAEVERPLISVSQLGRTGHRVEFAGNGGWIVHEQSGRRTRLRKAGGTYVLLMKVGYADDDSVGTPGFPRRR